MTKSEQNGAKRLGADGVLSSPDVNVATIGTAPLTTEKSAEPEKRKFTEFLRVLGYNGDKFFYFPFLKKQVVSLTPSAHSLNNLLQLMSLKHLRECADGDNDQRVALNATNYLMQSAQRVGIFQEEDRIRGCGIWSDAGRIILHAGDFLYVNGVKTDIHKVSSDYVYIAAAKLLTPAVNAMSDQEANELRTLCEMPSWENNLSGSLLAGWLVIAPVCAALSWRPHIWISGQAETGKSTVMDKIVRPVLGRMGMRVDGGTTEAAVRSIMGYDARPVVFDEAEPDRGNRTVMQGIIALARGASSGAVTRKFGQAPFKAQFAACFSSINSPVREFADESRISTFKLKKNMGDNASADYMAILHKIEVTLTDGYSDRLLRRIINNMPSLIKNIATFKAAARDVIKGARASDQIAPMLAGLFLLSSTKEVTYEAAVEWIARQDWTIHTTISDDPDPVRLLHHISTSLVRYVPASGNSYDVSVGSLIDAKLGSYANDISPEYADRVLKKHSILIKGREIWIGNRNENLGRLLKGTPWAAKWSSTLADFPGADKSKNNMYFSSGDKQRGIRIPVSFFEEQTELNITE